MIPKDTFEEKKVFPKSLNEAKISEAIRFISVVKENNSKKE